MWTPDDVPRRPIEDFERLLEGFLREPLELRKAFESVVATRTMSDPEIVHLLGSALWDVFSQNHQVLDAEGNRYDAGSFRTAAGVIAEAIDRRYRDAGHHDYLDFYLGTLAYPEGLDLTPVYRWIFSRLKEAGCEWRYSFPRLYVVDLGPRVADDDALSYDPSEGVRASREEAEREERMRQLAENLERTHRENVRSAHEAPLPRIVSAYRDIYGSLPEGWPHRDM